MLQHIVASDDIVMICWEIQIEQAARVDIPLRSWICLANILPFSIQALFFASCDEGSIAAADIQDLSLQLRAIGLDPFQSHSMIVILAVRVDFLQILILVKIQQLFFCARNSLDDGGASLALHDSDAILGHLILQLLTSTNAFLD